MNKAILMGRLTKEPEVRYSQNNLAVCNFTLAINRRFSKQQAEEKQADFIPIVTFGKTAEFCEKYFRKGQQVAVVGRIQTRTWDDNEGKRRYITEVIAEEAHFADSKQSDGTGGDYGAPRPDDYGYYPQMSPDTPMSTPSHAPAAAPTPSGRQSNSGETQHRQNSSSYGSSTDSSTDSSLDDGFVPVESESDLPF